MKHEPNYAERIAAVRAMDMLARSVNDETDIEQWLIYGVADGDIDENTKDEELMSYVEDDKVFADLMATFLSVMHKANKDGGLYIDTVVSS